MGARLFVPRAVTTGPALSQQAASPSRRPSGRLREVAALLLVAGGLFLILALVSCRITPGSTEDFGWVGPTGGFIARTLVQGFGVAAWLAPLELSLVAIPLFRGRPVGDLWLRLAADLTLLVVAAAMVQVTAPGAVAFGHAAASGNVGLLFGELMRELFSTVGSFLVGATIVGLILIGRSSFSFIEACHRLLALLEALSVRLAAWGRRFGGAWREARALRRAERNRAPRIETPDPDAAILLHLADDDSDWIPVEQTGVPPLAISQALKNARAPELDGLVFATPEAPLVAQFASEPESTPHAASEPAPAVAKGKGAASKRRAKDSGEGTDKGRSATVPSEVPPKTATSTARSALPEPAAPPASQNPGAATGAAVTDKGLRIVDTQPEREVERVAPPRTVPRRGEFQLPSTLLFDPPSETTVEIDRDAILENARRLEKTLADYGVTGKVEEVRPGPTVTMYEVSFEAGTRVSKVASLSDDLALGLSRKVRIIAPIPGKSLIGFELPNDERQPVCLRELIEDQRFEKLAERAPLPVVLGRDIVGAPFYADLASMPHVIVAGATGAGKSVGLNVMLSSLLLKRTPEDLRLLMIDPKVVELAPFDGIPHLLLPVVTDMKQAATALRWAVEEMERRYQLFADAGTKNIGTYNAWVKRVVSGEIPPPALTEVEALTADGALVTVPAAKEGGDGRPLPGKLPYVVIVVDEFADLMMQQGK
ncbi:MAG TPA: DNA translocase FtsK 4TM domain-containing protein, partial [Polyangiaceae bacterium]|nr:DNA translocase FtsK 4TM domain-containing protein [Polyangiaceae bacterium]